VSITKSRSSRTMTHTEYLKKVIGEKSEGSAEIAPMAIESGNVRRASFNNVDFCRSGRNS